MNRDGFTQDELYSMNPQKIYKADAQEVGFLLGGIGTGNVTLGSRGQLKDWEIFNRPAKGNSLHYSFFAIRTVTEGHEPLTKVLEAKFHSPHSGARGYHSGDVAGLPRLDSAALRGEYPFVWLDFEDVELPVTVSLEAFTPFIPLNADDSGIPGTIIRYKARNPSNKPVHVSIAGCMPNPVGFNGYDVFENMKFTAVGKNEYKQENGIKGLYYTSPKIQSHQLKYGNMAFITRAANVTAKPTWLIGNWWDGIQDFWDEFSRDGRLTMDSQSDATGSEFGPQSMLRVGALCIEETLQPGEEKVFEFVLAWYFPNRVKNWDEDSNDEQIEKNYYSTLFTDAWHAGKYLLANIEKLEEHTRNFHRALFQSTLPDYVLDAISSNITVLRSPTCFRIENGTFLAWEGCHDHKGSCAGTCTHVWNYAQTAAFLFPELEQTARLIEFNLETDENGWMAFRTWQVFDKEKHAMLPATDGQMGTIIRLYREWKISGDNALLQKVWHKASKALDFAFEYWDSDGDFVLDSKQHNTYDIEFYGPNSLTNSMFFAALKAGIQMAEFMKDDQHAAKYKQALEKGALRMDAMLWGGEYYIQNMDDVDQHRYQYGQGCLSDQVFGQLLAHTVGLGYILPKEHVQKAIKSVFDYNYKTDFQHHQSVQRTYALNSENGLLLCSWPKGGRPKIPFVYSDEVWTGIEYQVAAHLIYEGYIEEGLTLVKAVRERHDGYRRNPWDEVECGHHYSRSLASWSVLLALSGFQYDMVAGTMNFHPAIHANNFSTFWSTGKGWGIYKQALNAETGEMERSIEVLYGDMSGIRVNEQFEKAMV